MHKKCKLCNSKKGKFQPFAVESNSVEKIQPRKKRFVRAATEVKMFPTEKKH